MTELFSGTVNTSVFTFAIDVTVHGLHLAYLLWCWLLSGSSDPETTAVGCVPCPSLYPAHTHTNTHSNINVCFQRLTEVTCLELGTETADFHFGTASFFIPLLVSASPLDASDQERSPRLVHAEAAASIGNLLQPFVLESQLGAVVSSPVIHRTLGSFSFLLVVFAASGIHELESSFSVIVIITDRITMLEKYYAVLKREKQSILPLLSCI